MKKLKMIQLDLFVLFSIALCFPLLCPYPLNNIKRLKYVEFPKGDLHFTMIDSQGYIYIGNEIYDRIQKYDKNGSFLFGWFVTPGVNYFNTAIDSSDNIHLIGTGNKYYKYDVNGILLSHEILDDVEDRRRSEIINHHSKITKKIKEQYKKINTPFYWFLIMLKPTGIIYVLLVFGIGIYIYNNTPEYERRLLSYRKHPNK